jgi:hypothetical protein
MKYLSALLCLSVVTIVAAGFGQYVPKSFYTIDEDGNESPIVFIDSIPEVFHRSRRQVNNGFAFPAFNFPFPYVPYGSPYPVGSNPQNGVGLNNRFGESTPNVGNNPGNAGFHPGFGFPFNQGFQPLNIPGIPPLGAPGTSFTGTSISSTVQSQPGQGLASRFGEENTVSGQTITTTVNKDGKVTHTTTHIRPDGTTHTTQQKGKTG